MIIKGNLRFDPSAGYAIGVDVGGTKINAGIVDARGEIVCLRSMPTLGGQCSVGERIETAIFEVLNWMEDRLTEVPIRGIGIGTAGQVHWSTGTIRFASDLLPGYTGTPLKENIARQFGVPVYVDNDVNVLALAEIYAGSGSEASHMIGLALGTGVGGVLVENGQIVRGQWGGAGEIGHMSIDYQGRTCICGGIGCLEEYASGTSIARRMNELLLVDAAYDSGSGPVDARETIKRWLNGDSVAERVMNEAFEALGTAISSLLHLFNPEVVVVGGGLADVGEPLLRRIEEETRKKTMHSFYPDMGIRLSSNGNRSAMIGAAMQLWAYDFEGQ